MKITEACINKPVFAWMLMAATIVFGGVAATRIGISLMPDVDFPTINIYVTWAGASPEVVEHDVIDPLEEAVTQVEGVKSITAAARQGVASITIELDLSRDVDVALQEVQTKVSQAQMRLPKDLDAPVISKSNPEDMPILWVGIIGPYSRQMLADIARYQVKERLQTLPGIGEVMMGGYLDRNVRIWIDADRLNERGLTVTEVITALQRQHVELPAGQLTTTGREVNVRVMGEAMDLDTLRKVVIREQNSAPIYLEDVAMVEDGFEDVRRLARMDGAPMQGMGIKKQRGANAVTVAKEVKKTLEAIRPTLPPGVELRIMGDNTRFIEDSVSEIRLELLLSVFLTALVCWMFLGSISSTLNVILAIPMSMFGTIAIIYFLGFTLNTFTLLALGLAVGIVVDDAIMVMENIFRHAEEGKDRVRAAREGTEQIAFAALAATLAVVAIFLPVVFMKGIIGKFFMQFGITLSLAVLLSYVEAVTLAPSRCSQFLRTSREGRNRLGLGVDRAFEKLSFIYRRVLERGLNWPKTVLVMAVLLFAASLFVFKQMPGEFLPAQDQSLVVVRLQTAVGASLTETDRLFAQAEEMVSSHKEVQQYFLMIGGFGGTGVNTGIMFVNLVDPDKRAINQQQMMGILRKELNKIAGLKAVTQDMSQAGFSASRGFPIEFSVRGSDWNKLVEVSTAITSRLQESGMVTDLDTDYKLGIPELRIVPDRARAANLGISVGDVATTVNALVGGVIVGKYSTGSRRVDVRLRMMADQRTRPEDLQRLRVRTSGGKLVPLTSVITEEERPALQAISRLDRERAITVFANVASGYSQNEVLTYVETKLQKNLPPGYWLKLSGASVAMRESMSGLIFALILGIVVAYMVLASQFNSFLHPVTVLTILPLSVAGAAFALLIAGKSINIFSMIGLLLLMGIVKKNSIILVDYANELRRTDGLDARAAMNRAGPIRLRPIIMTSTATLMAALPPSLGLGPGAETRAPMAIAVIGGLVVSTVLSLLVVPAFYVVADSWLGRWGGLGRRRGRESSPK